MAKKSKMGWKGSSSVPKADRTSMMPPRNFSAGTTIVLTTPLTARSIWSTTALTALKTSATPAIAATNSSTLAA